MARDGFLARDELEAIGFAALGENVSIDRTVRVYGPERLSLGSNVRIDAFCVLSCGAGGIALGSYVHVAAYTMLAGAGRIELQDFVGISSRVSIYSVNDDYSGAALTGPMMPPDLVDQTVAPVLLERHVIVGSGSIILPGVTVGLGAAVGALTLVKHDVEPFAIVAGPDARVVGRRRHDVLELEHAVRSRERARAA